MKIGGRSKGCAEGRGEGRGRGEGGGVVEFGQGAEGARAGRRGWH